MRILILVSLLGVVGCGAKDPRPVLTTSDTKSAKKTADDTPKNPVIDPIVTKTPGDTTGKDKTVATNTGDDPKKVELPKVDTHDTPGEITGTEAEQAIKSLKGVGIAEAADGTTSAQKFYCSSATTVGAAVSCFVLVNAADTTPKTIAGEQFALAQAMGLLKRKGRSDQPTTVTNKTSYAVYEVSCKSKPAAVCAYVERDYIAP